MEFAELELDDRLLSAIGDLSYKKPTNVQIEVIPQAMSGFDILADAPTGTGKTAAFLLPCLQHLIDFPKKKLGLCRVLILTPTRELAIQVTEHAKSLAKYLPHISVGTIIGGVDHEEQIDVLTQKTDIVVATPGRLIEYLRKDSFDIRAVEVLVLDEADRMLDMGFIDDVKEISKAAHRREQTFLFSATLEGNLLEKFANEVLKNPVEIHIDSPRSEKKKVTQYKYYADTLEHKILLLERLLSDEKIDKTIVFIKTRERLMELNSRLTKDGFKFAYIRGEMDQEKRLAALSSFTENKVKIMLATDVAARGIDVSDITHVINFDLPRSADIYVHRIGRTARAGKKGTAINLIEAHDVPMMERIEHYTGESVTRRVIDDLKPQHKIADFSKKKKKDDDKKSEEDQKHTKSRKRDKLNKGKPDFIAKKIAKLTKEGKSQEEIAEIIEGIKKAQAERPKVEKKTKTKEVGEIPKDLPEKVKRRLKESEKVIPTVIIEDDEEYYDDDDIEMIQERIYTKDKAKSSTNNRKDKSEPKNANKSKRGAEKLLVKKNLSKDKFTKSKDGNGSKSNNRRSFKSDNKDGANSNDRRTTKFNDKNNAKKTYSRKPKSDDKK